MVRIPLCLGMAIAALAPATGRAAGLAPTGDFLYAIRMVETGNRYNCPPGRHGEQGPYQFRRSVWREYTSAPFAAARTRFSDTVAERHYRWIVAALSAEGVTPTVWRVAAAWNGGVTAVVRGRLTAGTRDYATRVSNLVEERTALRAAESPGFRVAYGGAP